MPTEFVQPDSNWQIDVLDLVRLRARLNDFNARLCTSNSAVQALERWCTEHFLATNLKIVARVQNVPVKSISLKQRERLKIGPTDIIRYRCVTLSYGDIVISEADNWYVQSHLTAEMNFQLDNSHSPFGQVIRSLDPTRQTLSSQILWPVSKRADPLLIPAHLLRHHALVLNAQGLPIAEVIENYAKTLFLFPERV